MPVLTAILHSSLIGQASSAQDLRQQPASILLSEPAGRSHARPMEWHDAWACGVAQPLLGHQRVRLAHQL
jgi:hypothetical protein